jgi:hypothetical protein
MQYLLPAEFVGAQWEFAGPGVKVAATALVWILTRAGPMVASNRTVFGRLVAGCSAPIMGFLVQFEGCKGCCVSIRARVGYCKPMQPFAKAGSWRSSRFWRGRE